MTVYLDHAATTPMRPEAVDAMLPWLTTGFGNPSGSHAVSRAARQAVDEARDVVAECLGCDSGEVIFTGGGTEADNLAVAGVVGAAGGTAMCTEIEHHAVLHSVQAVGGHLVPVEPSGVVDLDALREALDQHPDTTVVSVMLANNEVGTVQPLEAVAGVVRAAAPGAVLHTDAVQAFAWLDVAAGGHPADLISIAAHKFGGPKGVGALVARAGVKLEPLLRGGGQERDRRSGTHNVAGIVAMAAAMQATVDQRAAAAAAIRVMRDSLADGVVAAIPGVTETGGAEGRVDRLPNICHLRFAGVESEALLVLLDNEGVCASAGSACASGALEPSHVLAAMGVDPASARSSVRFSLGWPTTASDVEAAMAALRGAVAQLRDTRPVRA